MAEEPERLKRDIENTRASLTRDVDMLAEKASPGKVAQRRWNTVRERVMGSAEQVRESAVGGVQEKASHLSGQAAHLGDVAGGKARDAAGAIRDVPRAAADRTQGNPLAAGVIAFGVGLLAAGLIPVTDAERRAGQQLKEGGGDLTGAVKDFAAGLKDDLSGTVQHAVEEVKGTAREAAQATTEQARSSAQEAGDTARKAATNAS
ncbi:DUF3618 domain-containing protein [Actinoplanes utahensis]|uniref:DUF3618 domain-containing protein n=1 Tax=Actinoplanes utahensis TaxID=1869 RepID=A0A0A6X1P9_ACTUT|nr:DUF3618 domain-containing protein [Actinoplanes utahensis]KHD74027.1 hypothetical protein MB27_31195 [Actinoplanes utahensis]GIF35251.1 hypothetical protein Aut01nite_82370 [Actinoplanes utahensis]